MRGIAGLTLAGVLMLAGSAEAATPISREAQLQDLAQVRAEYLPKEMAYTPATRAAAEARLKALEARAGRLTPSDLLVGLAEVAALADNAHSGVRYHTPEALPDKRLPLRLIWFPDALVVARAHGDAADLAGARVLAVEGLAPEALYGRVRVLLGGKDVDRKKRVTELIESEGVLKSLGVARDADALTLRLRLADGRKVTRRIAMIPQAVTPTAEFERLWAPQALAGETGWTPALKPKAVPLYLRDADRPFRLETTPVGLYLQFRSNSDEDGFPIADFLKDAAARIAADKPANLIVDLRFDIGGNLLTTLDFMRKLPSATAGRTYLLVGPYTFSAGIVSAAALEKSGGDRVVIVGDEVGDRMRFWSEGDNVRLANSKLALRYTNGQWDLGAGCAGEPACLDHYINVNPVSVEPDVRASLTAKDWLAGRDPGMEAVMRLIETRP